MELATFITGIKIYRRKEFYYEKNVMGRNRSLVA